MDRKSTRNGFSRRNSYVIIYRGRDYGYFRSGGYDKKYEQRSDRTSEKAGNGSYYVNRR